MDELRFTHVNDTAEGIHWRFLCQNTFKGLQNELH